MEGCIAACEAKRRILAAPVSPQFKPCGFIRLCEAEMAAIAQTTSQRCWEITELPARLSLSALAILAI